VLPHDQGNEIFKGFYSCSTLAILLPRFSSTLRIRLTRRISYNNVIWYDWYTDNRSRKTPVRRIYSGGVRFHKEQQVSLPTPPPPVIFHVFLPRIIKRVFDVTSHISRESQCFLHRLQSNSLCPFIHSSISKLPYSTATVIFHAVSASQYYR
jgi:hypothetical protein